MNANASGYLTRYAPGVREHGGLYTHAETWGVMAAAIMKDAPETWRTYCNMSLIYRGMNPDHYKTEPYVTPGNVDGPDSPNFGWGGWSWYTGSAAWMFRVGIDWILGVRARLDGLLIDPCIPEDWTEYRLKRRFQGSVYNIHVLNPNKVSSGVKQITVDGSEIEGKVIPEFADGLTHKVEVVMG